MTSWYRTGTVEATNGQTTVTGTLTAWLANVKVGDLWSPDADGRGYEITAVNSNTEIEIFPAYAGSTGSGRAYGIARISPNWNSVSALSVSLADLVETQQSILTGEGAPDNSFGQDGDVYFRQDEAEYYAKIKNKWDLVTSLTGPQGPGGPSYQASSASSVSIGTGAKVFTVESGRGYSAGQWLRASNDASNYMEGTVTSYSGTTLVLNVPTGRAVGSGTYAAWNINITGDIGPANSLTIGSVATGAVGSSASASITGVPPSQTLNLTIPRGNTGPQGIQGVQGIQGTQGIQGPVGPGYAGTSTTSHTIGTGSKTFTTQSGLGYVPGSRARAASQANPMNYMAGTVTAYSGTSLTMFVDKAGGSGTRTDWNLTLDGQPGADGSGAGTVNTANGGLELIGGGSTVQMADTAVTPGSYGSASGVPVITIDQKGRITAASTAAIPDAVAMAIVFGA